jgi:diguanylate cyclase (GGDEF)-like protein/PAS domain S-box-containing protein
MTPSAEALTGYTAEEFVATPSLLDFIVEDADRHLWEQFLRCDPQTGGQPVKELRLRIRRKNGERCWIHLSCRPVVESDGRFLGLRLTARDITDQIKADEQIRNLAYFDPLTGLPNRRLLMDRLGQGLIASQRSREYGALLLIDLDRFKEINDTQGHEMGDRLLRETARRLDGSVRKEDTVARLGGDEFVVQLDNLSTDEQQAAGKAEKIAETVRQALNHCFNCDEGQSEYLNSCSIGITLFLGTDSSVEILLKQADLAMYQAKDAGRNAIRFFNPAMQAAIDRRIALITGLRQGLDHQEFSLHYQPQYDVSGQPVGAEALVRWDRPGQGSTLPAGFIPLAEETGFILPLGQWVLDTAVAQLKAWESQGGWSGLSLSVNVSPRQFLQKATVSGNHHRYANNIGRSWLS